MKSDDRLIKLPNHHPRKVCIAPMLDWSDRHCRMFHRQISRYTWLYTEMVTTGALIHGDIERHLNYSEAEHPVALQLGGSEPEDLAYCAKLGEKWGYDEINLNCGCPSERVQKGAFGACLMKEVSLVSDCIKAMRDAASIEITVKHRIGIDNMDSYDFVRDFVGDIADAGCRVFIVHGRSAILKGLSPKENREIPPLRYDVVYRLKKDFPGLEIILNGGIASEEEIDDHLHYVDGVMIGRAAYHNPYLLAGFDSRYYGDISIPRTRRAIFQAMLPYMEEQLSLYGEAAGGGLKLNSMTRHMLGLMAGQPGARRFRRMLSDATLLSEGTPALLLEAVNAMNILS